MKKDKNWKRIGKCKRCGACCRLSINVSQNNETYLETEGRRSYLLSKGALIKRVNKTFSIVSLPAPCIHYYEKDGLSGCYLHGTFLQPQMCKDWPSWPEPYYQAVNRFKKCGYRFVESEE